MKHPGAKGAQEAGDQMAASGSKRPARPEYPPDFSLAVCVLASGSRGNSIYVAGGRSAILIDAGLSGVEIERRLQSRNISPESLDAIVVSHEHTDHVKGVGVLSRRYNLPVYMNDGTRAAALTQLGKISRLKRFECGHPFQIDALTLHPFSISHDARDPVGFAIHHDGVRVGIATDLGIATAMVKQHLRACRLMILEANHDPKMLIDGPYPWPLKQRIKSRSGHLSNEDSKKLLMEVRHDRLEAVILAHLSETNNTSEMALQAVRPAIAGSRIRLAVAGQDECGETFYLK